jgi:hypothetical protein
VGGRTWLLDMQGRVVHTWPVGTNPHLLDKGRDLSPKGTITERAAQGLDPQPPRRPSGRGGR